MVDPILPWGVGSLYIGHWGWVLAAGIPGPREWRGHSQGDQGEVAAGRKGRGFMHRKASELLGFGDCMEDADANWL